VTCRPEVLDPRLPGSFQPLGVARRVVVVKRKHGERFDRWKWDGDLVGTAGRGWRVVRHVRGRDERRLLAAGDAEPLATLTLRWLGIHSPATIVVKCDESGAILEVKVDAALPVPFRRGRFVFTDLDVDVVRDAAGAVHVRDWDTFESRVELLGYTAASRAVAVAGEVFGLVVLAAWEPTLAADVASILALAPAPGAVSVSEGGAAWLRRAGSLDAGGGESVLWSVAEGRRGRRWRSVRRDAAGALLSDLLLEVDPEGRWTRLELASAEGILTLHPEPAATAVHGNLVTERGVLPLAFAWSPQHRLVVEGEPVAAVALAPMMPLGRGPALLVTAQLEVVAHADLAAPAAAGDALPGPSWPLEG